MKVEFTKSFDENFLQLPRDLQEKTKNTIEKFLDCFLNRQFPKGLRVHKCGPFLSLSVTMSHRIFVLPIEGGVRFVFIGDHNDADRYLKS